MTSRRQTARRPAYVLLETVVATGLLVVGLAVLGAQVQEAHRSVRKMERRIHALMLAEQHLAELQMGLIKLESVDEIEEGDFGPRHPDYGWRLITHKTAIEDLFLQRLDILFHQRDEAYREDDFDFDSADSLHTVYAMQAVPQPVHFGQDFGLNDEELLDLSERFAALGIPGLDPEKFDPRFFQTVDFEELIKSAPLIFEALHIDISDLEAMLPPDLLEQVREALEQAGGAESTGLGDPNEPSP